MTKNEIAREAEHAGWRAVYSARLQRWFFTRLWKSGNTKAFDAIVLANLKRRWSITDKR